MYTHPVGKDGVQDQAISGRKRKQGSLREHSVKKKKKKKKIHRDGDPPLGHPECSWPLESSPAKGSKKKPVRVEAPEYIPLGDGPRASMKKKVKSKKRVEQADTVESALKRKKRQESKVAEPPWEEEPDTDLEVVLEKKGNMDEAHIDQVCLVLIIHHLPQPPKKHARLLTGHRILVPEASGTPQAPGPASAPPPGAGSLWPPSLTAGRAHHRHGLG